MDLALDNSNCDSNSISDLPIKRRTTEETPADTNDDSSLPTPEKKLKLDDDREDLIPADFKNASRRLFGEKVLSGQSTSKGSSSSFKGQMPRKNDESKPSVEPNSNEDNDPLCNLVKFEIKEEVMDTNEEQPRKVSERLAPEAAFSSVKEELHSKKSQRSQDSAMEVTGGSAYLANTRIEERDNVSLKVPPEHVDGGAWKLLVLHKLRVLNFTAGFQGVILYSLILRIILDLFWVFLR